MMYFKTSSLKIIRKPTAVSWPAANSCHLLDVSQSPFTAADKPRDLSSHPEVAEASGSLTWAYITVTRRAGYDTDGWGPTPEFLLHFIWAGTHWFAFLTFHSLLSPFVLVTTLWEPLVYIFFPPTNLRSDNSDHESHHESSESIRKRTIPCPPWSADRS